MVRTSVTQLANFMITMRNGGRFDETLLPKEETGNEQGLGCFKTGDYWGHDSGDPGCSTEMMFIPKIKVGFIIFANADTKSNEKTP